MKKSNLFSSILVLSLVLLFSQCDNKSDNNYPFQFKFITEEYQPYNFTENATIIGFTPELLKEICNNMNIPFEVETLPWDEGYDLVQQLDNAVLFSTVLNADRKKLFKWAGPIASIKWMFYSNVESQIELKSLEDAKLVGSIGVIKDYAIEQYLVQEGFTNLVYCTDQTNGFDKLLKGEIDLFPSDRIAAEAALQALNSSIYHVNTQITIMTDLIYFAFNKNIPDEVVSDFQNEIDNLKEDGTLKSLSEKYLNTSNFPGSLLIYTEQYPPLTFRNSEGEITGFGTDIVYEIMKRNELYIDINLTPWSNGYNLALNNPNVCLFTMDRTEIRENLFQWVGPIGTNTTWFYIKEGSGISINSLDDARNLSSIGTVDSWFSTQYLQELGFTNLIGGSDPNTMTQKLMMGEVDAFVCTDVTFPDILKDLGYEYAEVIPAFSLMSSDYYVAFSKSTSVEIVNQWQTTLDAVKQDGTYDAIHQKWFQ